MREEQEGTDVGPDVEDAGAVGELNAVAQVDPLLEDVLVEVLRLGRSLGDDPQAVGPDVEAALEAIGFQVTGLSARVRWMSPPGSPLGPREHITLMVELPDGSYLVDVGFGACVMDSPLQFKTDMEQATAMGTYRLSESDGLFSLSVKQPPGWRTMYAFDLVPQIQSDYELGNWYTSTSPLVP